MIFHHPQLELYAYGLSTVGSRNHYGACVEALEFSTVAPGGYGHLTVELRTRQGRIVAPELQLFANVALMDGPFPCFLGRWDEPSLSIGNQGELFRLTAQGAAINCKDDPADSSYTNRTAAYIINDQVTSGSTGTALNRNRSLLLDADQSLVLPDNPSGPFTIGFAGETLEDVLNKLLPILGDYTWAIWGHAVNRDRAAFPTWQLQVHKRDTSTVSYTALQSDIAAYEVRPSSEYSFNVITVSYKNAANGFNTSVTVQDSRLGSDASQGIAPFPWKHLKKDYQDLMMSNGFATSLANAYLKQYLQGGFKLQFDLNRVRDMNGKEIPLWQVRADTNIFLPDLSVASTITSPQLPLKQFPDGNIFYIRETTYSEQIGQTPKLTVVADTFLDRIDFLIQRLQYQENLRGTNKKTHGHVHVSGESETGAVSIAWGGNALATDTYETTSTFKTQMASTPTSITLSNVTATNATNVAIPSITQDAFILTVQPAANGSGKYRASYATVGN